eukprot:2346102-Prymnesium_polylepis.1
MSSHLGHRPRSPTCGRDWQIELVRSGQKGKVRGSYKVESALATSSSCRRAAPDAQKDQCQVLAARWRTAPEKHTPHPLSTPLFVPSEHTGRSHRERRACERSPATRGCPCPECARRRRVPRLSRHFLSTHYAIMGIHNETLGDARVRVTLLQNKQTNKQTAQGACEGGERDWDG